VCKDKQAIHAAIAALRLKTTQGTTHKTFDGKTIEGIAFRLPGWQKDVIIDAAGTAHYDNYKGMWGNIDELDEFLHRYTIETTKTAAMAAGYSVEETENDEGQTELFMTEY